MQPISFITGTDTGVGKTVLTALLARHLRQQGIAVAALKPVAAGGREDARALRAALADASTLRSSAATEDGLTLDEINPWHFRAPLAPLLAARRERRQVRRADVLAHIRQMQKQFEAVLVEGAGGLLSPLGEDFNSRDLIAALRATPVIVGPNRIGVVNRVLLTLNALPRPAAARARVVLMSSPRPDASTKTNAGLLAEFFDAARVFELPWLGRRFEVAPALKNRQMQRTLQTLIQT